MTTEPVSEHVLNYVQMCQIAVGICAADDYVAQVSALWSLLEQFPRGGTGSSLAMTVVAIHAVAEGLFRERHYPIHPNRRPTVRRGYVNRVLRIAHEEYACVELTVGAIAKRLVLSPEYISRALAAEFGHSFRTHLNGIRLLAAVVRLYDSTDSIHVIAERVGYRRTGELDRRFRRVFAMSPRAFAVVLRHRRAKYGTPM